MPFKFNDPDYNLEILKRQFQFFGPFPGKYAEIADKNTVEAILRMMDELRGKMKPFHLITEREMCRDDKEFIGWVMKLDPRDRPTAEEILAHEWWDGAQDEL